MAFLDKHQLTRDPYQQRPKGRATLVPCLRCYPRASFIPIMRPCVGYWSGRHQRTSFEHKRAYTGRLAPQGQHSWRAYSQRGPLVSAYLPVKRSVGI